MNEQQHKDECLARWILDSLPNRKERHAFVSNVQKMHGAEYASELEKLIHAEVKRRNEYNHNSD